MYGGGYKSLVSANLNFNNILIGIMISFFAMQCSKGSDPAVTPVAVNGTCQSGQTLQADGTCKAPDGTITCPVGKTKDASGNCVDKTCPSGQTLNASNGQCETITCPSGQILNASKQCVTQCIGGYAGPSVMMFKYLDKTNPNPSSVIGANADMAFIVVKGCEENNPTWLSSQSIFNALAYFEIKNSNNGVILSSLSFASNTWDSKILSIGSDGTSTSKILSFTPKNISNIKNGTGIEFYYVIGVSFWSNCINSDCFVRINNSIVTLPTDPGATAGFASYFIGGVERGVAIYSSSLREATQYNPLVKNAINDMYNNYSMKAGVTWSTNVNWRSVLIP